MFYINIKMYTDDGIDYIAYTDIRNEEKLNNLMNDLCNDYNVSIFWALDSKTGQIFISLHLCDAKICSGGIDLK